MKTSQDNRKIALTKEKTITDAAVSNLLAKIDQVASSGGFETAFEVTVPKLLKDIIKILKKNKYAYGYKNLGKNKYLIKVYWGPSTKSGSMFKSPKREWIKSLGTDFKQ